MTKQEKIQEAYGEYWEQVKDFVDENGWLDKSVFRIIELNYEDLGMCCLHKNGLCLPDKLQGIETNNGWIKIESESDLPKTEDDYHIYIENKDLSIAYFDKSDGWSIACLEITHYQPIIKPEPPIY